MPFAVKTPAHLYAGSTRPRTPAKALELLAKGSHGGQERYAMQQLEKVEHELQLLAEDAGSAEADVPVWDLAAELNSAPPPRPEHDEGVDLDAEIEQFRGRTSGRWQTRAETSAASADLADPLSEYAAPPTPSFSTRSTFGSTPTGRLDLSSIDARSEFSRPPMTPRTWNRGVASLFTSLFAATGSFGASGNMFVRPSPSAKKVSSAFLTHWPGPIACILM